MLMIAINIKYSALGQNCTILWLLNPNIYRCDDQIHYTCQRYNKIWNYALFSVSKKGFVSKYDLVEVVNATLYKLKSGCQWRLLPMGHLFIGDEIPCWNTMYHHFREWSKEPEWKTAFSATLMPGLNPGS